MSFVPLPHIVEGAAELLELRRVERDERRRERLHALWLVASGTVQSRSALARQLGRNRETVSRWLEDYQREGLATLLRAPRPAGRPHLGGIGLPAATQEAIRARLAQSRGERGYLSLWRWARAEHALAYSYSHFIMAAGGEPPRRVLTLAPGRADAAQLGYVPAAHAALQLLPAEYSVVFEDEPAYVCVCRDGTVWGYCVDGSPEPLAAWGFPPDTA